MPILESSMSSSSMTRMVPTVTTTETVSMSMPSVSSSVSVPSLPGIINFASESALYVNEMDSQSFVSQSALWFYMLVVLVSAIGYKLYSRKRAEKARKEQLGGMESMTEYTLLKTE